MAHYKYIIINNILNYALCVVLDITKTIFNSLLQQVIVTLCLTLHLDVLLLEIFCRHIYQAEKLCRFQVSKGLQVVMKAWLS